MNNEEFIKDVEILGHIGQLITELSFYPKTNDWHTFQVEIKFDFDKKETYTTNPKLVIGTFK